MIKQRKAFICGVKGKKLNKNEILFLKKHKPWGVILFARNIHTIKGTARVFNLGYISASAHELLKILYPKTVPSKACTKL